MSLKLEACQASTVFKYINIKIKLLKTNLHIKFNKKCLQLNIIPKYSTIRINNTSEVAKKVKRIAEVTWIKEEIRQLYNKKTRLNELLYKSNLKLLNTIHPVLIFNLMQYVNNRIMKVILPIAQKHDKKINNLISSQHNNMITKCKHTFYSRVSNLTDIEFDSRELNLLNKGLKYNVPDFNKNHLTREIIHAEAAIKTVPNVNSQNELRVLINSKLNKALSIHNKNYSQPFNLKSIYFNNLRVINQIRNKVEEHNAIVTKADKGNTLVIISREVYQQKVYDFIHNNNIKPIDVDPTSKFVKSLNNAINKCTHLFNDTTRRYLKPMAAQAPHFTGLLKIHKEDTPIRPLINYTTAPGYKAAKKLAEIIKNNITLENNHSIKNSSELVDLTRDINIETQYKLVLSLIHI